jgi:hypothetical protein
MPQFLNGSVFLAASGGTGSFVVSSAITGWQTPASAGAVDGAQYRYRAYSADWTQWEIGTGTYTASTTTLTRSSIVASSSGGSAVNFTGAPAVSITILAVDLDNTRVVGYGIDGGGVPITTGVQGSGVRVPFDCIIQSATLQSNVSGSIVIDIWKDTYANFPPTVADSICASAKPTISASNKSEDVTLTGWTKTITAGDILYFNVDSCSTITNVTLTLKASRT